MFCCKGSQSRGGPCLVIFFPPPSFQIIPKAVSADNRGSGIFLFPAGHDSDPNSRVSRRWSQTREKYGELFETEVTQTAHFCASGSRRLQTASTSEGPASKICKVKLKNEQNLQGEIEKLQTLQFFLLCWSLSCILLLYN